MSDARAQSMDRITVLVFKDNRASRTFQVPLGWLSRLGILFALGAVILLTTSFLAIRYYRAAMVGDPARLHELEIELGELRESYEKLQSRAALEEDEPEHPPADSGFNVPAAISFSRPQPFTAIPAPAPGAEIGLPATDDLPIRLDAPRISWNGDLLRLNFNIQYVKRGGSQQGRIVVLARGPNALFTYPGQVLKEAGAETLLNPNQGEYFSISRFRGVRAELGSIPAKAVIRELEILIFNSDGGLMIHNRLPAPARTAPDTSP